MGSFLLDILEFVALALFLRGLFRSLRSRFPFPVIRVGGSAGVPPSPASPGPQCGETARDPVCGMFVSTELSQKLRHGGETLHFCSPTCLEKYEKDTEHVASR
jgi:YHS domain-containing protein